MRVGYMKFIKSFLGRVINDRLLVCKWRFSALPFLKYVFVFSDTVLETHHFSFADLRFATKSFN
jgi:hypothetical protein